MSVLELPTKYTRFSAHEAGSFAQSAAPKSYIFLTLSFHYLSCSCHGLTARSATSKYSKTSNSSGILPAKFDKSSTSRLLSHYSSIPPIEAADLSSIIVHNNRSGTEANTASKSTNSKPEWVLSATVTHIGVPRGLCLNT
jgi:hypothetical protein